MRWHTFIDWMHKGLAASVVFAMISCGQAEKLPTLHGEFTLAVDETMQPVIEECLRVYFSQYPEVEVDVKYLPEAEAMADFANGKATILLATREPDSVELVNFTREKIGVESYPIALETVYLVQKHMNIGLPIRLVHPHGGDSYLKLVPEDIRKERSMVMESPYTQLQHYLDAHQDYGTIAGAAWKHSQGTSLSFSNSMHFTPLKPPFPSTRIWYAINGEPRLGPGSGFIAFLRGVRGQKIIAKTHVTPAIPANRLVHLKGSDLVFAPETLVP